MMRVGIRCFTQDPLLAPIRRLSAYRQLRTYVNEAEGEVLGRFEFLFADLLKS